MQFALILPAGTNPGAHLRISLHHPVCFDMNQKSHSEGFRRYPTVDWKEGSDVSGKSKMADIIGQLLDEYCRPIISLNEEK